MSKVYLFILMRNYLFVISFGSLPLVRCISEMVTTNKIEIEVRWITGELMALLALLSTT